MRQPEILIVGLGGVGSWMLELLAHRGHLCVVGADLNEECDERAQELIACFKALAGS